MNNCVTKVPIGTIYLYQGLDQNCKPVWNYADNGSGNSTIESGTALRLGDSVVGSDKLLHIIDEGFIGSILDIIDTDSLDLSLVNGELKGDVNPVWVKSLLSVSPSTYISLSYNQATGVISASLNQNLLFQDYFANLQIGAFAYGATFLVGVDDKKYVIPAQTVSYESSSKRLYISNGNFAVLPLTANELSSELNNLPTTTDAVYGSTIVLGKDNAWHKLPVVSGGGSGTDSQQLSINGNILSLTNGGSVTLPSGGSGVTTNDISSSVNTITSVVNGVVDTSPIVNSNQISLNQNDGLVSSVNGVTSSQSIQSGVAARIAAFDSGGALIHAPVPSGGGGSGAITNDLSSNGNIMTSNVDGHIDTANIINFNSLNLNQTNGLQSTINGVTASLQIPSGVLSKAIGYDSSGNAVYGNPTSITSNSVVIDSNSLTSNVNGFQSVQPIINGTATKMLGFNSLNAPVVVPNTPSLSLSQNNGLQAVVNGATASLPIPSGVLAKAIGYDSSGNAVYGNPSSITSSSVQLAPGFITTTVNGFGAAQPILTGTPVKILGFDASDAPITVSPASLGGSGGVTTNDISSSVNTITSVVNGVSDTATIINTNQININQSAGLTSLVNGVSASQPIGSGVAARMAAFDYAGAFIHAPVPSGGSGSGANANDLSSAANIMTSNVDGHVDTAPIINSNQIDISPTFLTSNVNGIISNRPILTGTATKILGFDSSNIPITVTPASLGVGGATTNDISSSQNTITSNVNGVSDTAAIINSNQVNISSSFLTSNVNGIISNRPILTGTATKILGFDSNDIPITVTPASLGGGGGTSYTFNDTNSIDLVTTGTAITGNVKRSSAANNSIIENGDGIYSPSTIADLSNPSVIPQGVAAVMGVTDVLGKDLKWRTLPTVSGGGGTDSQTLSIAGNTLSISNGNSVTLPSGGGGVSSNTLSSSGNTMTSNVNGVVANSNIITFNSLVGTGFQIVSTVNNVQSAIPFTGGAIDTIIGFDANGDITREYLSAATLTPTINHYGGGNPSVSAQYQQFNLGVGTVLAPNSLTGQFNLSTPTAANNLDYTYIVIPELICNIAGFQNIPVPQAFGECAIDLSTDNGGSWTTYASNSVQTNVRSAGNTPAGYSNTIYSHDKWKTNLVITSSALSTVQINWRIRVQVYSGILASVYVWTPNFYVIGIP